MFSLCLPLVLALVCGPEIRLERWENGKPRVEYEVRVEADGSEVLHGSYTSWYEDGKVEIEGAYTDGLRSGDWSERWPNGKRRYQGSYAMGLREGAWKLAHESGPRSAEGRYRSGRRTGPWKFWDEQRKPDEQQSGTYELFSAPVGELGLVVEGALLRGRRRDLWTWRAPDGGLRLAGHYGPSGLQGPWVALFADGSLNDELSGEYTAGRRTGPLEGWPVGVVELPRDLSNDPRRAAALPVDAQAAELLAAWLAAEQGAREGPWSALAAAPREALLAAVAWLQTVDYDDTQQQARARRVVADALPRLLGTGYPWQEGENAAALNRRQASLWRAHLELADLDATAWRTLLDPDWRWATPALEWTVLGGPAAPGDWRESGTAASARASLDRSEKAVALLGGSGTAAAVDGGLDYLQRVQSADGSWEPGTPRTLEATAWALLALTGNDLSVFDEGEQAQCLARGLRWLAGVQRRGAGCFATPLCYEVRSHALALWAVGEALQDEQLATLLSVAGGARRFLLEQQLEDGSFPRDVGAAQGDPFTTLYAWLALDALARTPLGPSEEAAAGALAWLAQAHAPDGSLVEPEGRTPAATAASAWLRLRAGLSADRDALLGRQVGWLIGHPSSIEPRHPQLDAEYLMFGALTAFRVGDPLWADWNKNMKIQLLQVQQRTGAGERMGSWDPVGVGPMDRSTITAQRVITFQSYFRYPAPGSR